MNYRNETKENCATEELRSAEPLVELMNRTKEVGFAIADMARRIESNLFGPGDIREEKCASPMCHREALEQHHSTLCDAANTLSRVCNMLGV